MDNLLDLQERCTAAVIRLLGTERDIIEKMRERFSKEAWPEFHQGIALLAATTGRVIITGMGKSGHVGKKITATLASLGTPTHFMHAAEASHGDLGMFIRGDVLICLSNSGNTAELGAVLARANRIGVPVIGITMNPESKLAKASTVTLLLPKMKEGCILGLAPTTSTTAQIALGDALAVALAVRRDFNAQNFNELHPGGALGNATKPVAELMMVGTAMPLVAADTPSTDIPVVMAEKSVNTVGVCDEDGSLIGLIGIKDVDHRCDTPAINIMRGIEPVVQPTDSYATAMTRMETYGITGCFVVDGDKPVGFVKGGIA
jgi:arabinose-5-phosphate isomerase